MKRGFMILMAALAVGLCMFICTQIMFSSDGPLSSKAMPKENGSLLPELHWLQNWLQLDDEQMHRVKTLHMAYLPKCEELCHRVFVSNEDILALSGRSTSVDAKMRSAMDERAKLAVECQGALLEHVYQTATFLRPEQSKKYLDLMVPYTLGITTKDVASNRLKP